MPTYVYECRVCERTFEVEQRMTDEPLTECDCGEAGAVRRVIQPAGIAFKGGGFFVNDAPKSCPTPDSCACKNNSQD